MTLAYYGLLALKEILEQKQEFSQNVLANFSLECLKILPSLDLQGRLQRLAPNLYLDVAHNVNAAQALVKQFKNHYFSQNKCVLIYNSYFDKNPRAVLSALAPIIKRVEILEIANMRMIAKAQLEKILQELKIEFKDFKMMNLNPEENYLVCGSFSVVAEFLTHFSKTKR